jgi:hypothetical protein
MKIEKDLFWYEKRVAELEEQLTRTQNSDDRNFDRWKKVEAQLAEKDKLLLLAKDALTKVLAWVDDCADTSPEYCFDPVEIQANDAIAAIADSKLVEGLILCEKKEVVYKYNSTSVLGHISTAFGVRLPSNAVDVEKHYREWKP